MVMHPTKFKRQLKLYKFKISILSFSYSHLKLRWGSIKMLRTVHNFINRPALINRGTRGAPVIMMLRNCYVIRSSKKLCSGRFTWKKKYLDRDHHTGGFGHWRPWYNLLLSIRILTCLGRNLMVLFLIVLCFRVPGYPVKKRAINCIN